MNKDKHCSPARALTCLFITLELDNISFSIKKGKLEEIYAEFFQVDQNLLLLKGGSNLS